MLPPLAAGPKSLAVSGAGGQQEKLGAKQGRAGANWNPGGQTNVHLALTISKLHSPCDLKKKLVAFTMELHVPLTQVSEKLKKI